MFEGIRRAILRWQDQQRMEEIQLRWAFMQISSDKRGRRTAKSYALGVLNGVESDAFKQTLAWRYTRYSYFRKWLWGNGDETTLHRLATSERLRKNEAKAAARNPAMTREIAGEVLIYWNLQLRKAKSKFVAALPDELVDMALLQEAVKQMLESSQGEESAIAEKAIAGQARKLLDCDESIPDSWVIKLLS